MFWGKKRREDAIELTAPIAGQVVPITAVPDDVFATEVLGSGVAIIPSEEIVRVYAPADALVEVMFDTGHAASLNTVHGVEVLIHAGIDTVRLGGAHFSSHCKTGDRVKAGQLLFSFDAKAISQAGFNAITPVIITNLDAFKTWKPGGAEYVNAGDLLLALTH